MLRPTWRWFGPDDPVRLEEIRQTGAEGIVSALHHFPNGAVWTPEEIRKRKNEIEAAGFRWEIVESVPVHEAIKTGAADRDHCISNYVQTLRNLAAEGIRHVVYNFMALTDWTRTDLAYVESDGAITIRYDRVDLAVFDLFILERKAAVKDHPPEIISRAEERYRSMSAEQIKKLSAIVLMGLPGTVEDLPLDDFRKKLEKYHQLGKEGLRKNFLYFLDKVIPEAAQLGITMSLHADDPPMSIFGLPRIVSDADDLEFITSSVTSAANSLCFCTGTFGGSPGNKVEEMISRFAPRISFAHLRNVRIEEDGSFYESKLFEGSLDMVQIAKILAEEQKRRGAGHPIPFRPDHGQAIFQDSERSTYPGYPLSGRMKSLAELRGLFSALI